MMQPPPQLESIQHVLAIDNGGEQTLNDILNQVWQQESLLSSLLPFHSCSMSCPAGEFEAWSQ